MPPKRKRSSKKAAASTPARRQSQRILDKRRAIAPTEDEDAERVRLYREMLDAAKNKHKRKSGKRPASPKPKRKKPSSKRAAATSPPPSQVGQRSVMGTRSSATTTSSTTTTTTTTTSSRGRSRAVRPSTSAEIVPEPFGSHARGRRHVASSSSSSAAPLVPILPPDASLVPRAPWRPTGDEPPGRPIRRLLRSRDPYNYDGVVSHVFGRRIQDFRFAQNNLWKVDTVSGAEVYKNDLNALRDGIVNRLRYDVGNIIYKGADTYKYQVLVTKYTEGEGYNIEGKDIPMAGIAATHDVALLIRKIERWFHGIQDPRETALFAFGSDEEELDPDTILSGEFTIRRIRRSTAEGGGRTPIQFGAFTTFTSDTDGQRMLFSNFYTCCDNMFMTESNNCLLYALRKALLLHHTKFSPPAIWRRKAGLPDKGMLDVSAIRPLINVIGNIICNILVITDMPTIQEQGVSDNVIYSFCTYTEATPQYIVYSAEAKHFTYLVSRTAIPSILGGALGNAMTNPPKAIRIYKPPSGSKRKVPSVNFVFDYETVRQLFGDIVPYSGAWITQSLSNGDTYDGEYVNITTTKKQEPGKEITDTFVNYLKRHAKNHKTEFAVAMGFNNSRFDNFILLRDLYKHDDIAPTLEVFIAKSSILTIRFQVGGMKVQVVDLCRMVNTSLAKASSSFGLSKLKGCQDHKEIQRIYEKGDLLAYLHCNEQKLREYNMCDVTVTAELAHVVRRSLTDMLDLPPGQTSETALTLASLSAKTWKNKLKLELQNNCSTALGTEVGVTSEMSKGKYGKLVKAMTGLSPAKVVKERIEKLRPHAPQSRALYNFVAGSIIGGRAQAFQVGVFEGRFTVIDVVSIYPFAMTKRMPVGEFVPATAADFVYDSDNFKHGIWDISISYQKEWVPNVIPFRSATAPLDWFYKGPMRVALTTVDVISLYRYHGECFLINGGWVWPESSMNVFSCYMTPVKNAKVEEDRKKNAGETYNPAKREMAKLAMNSLSGKVGQNIVSEVKEILTNTPQGHERLSELLVSEEKNEFTKGLKIIKITNDILYAHGTYNQDVMSFKYDAKKVHPKQLAGLIYAISRDHMMRMIYECRKDIIGMDTDSGFITINDYEKLLGNFPTWFGNEFGQFVEEMSEMYHKAGLPYNSKTSMQRFYMLAPKCYLIVDLDTNKILKIRFKGVSSCAKLITRQILAERFPDEDHEEILAKFGISDVLDKIETNVDDLLAKLPSALCEDLYKAMLADVQIWVVQSQIVKNVSMSTIRQSATHKEMKLRRA